MENTRRREGRANPREAEKAGGGCLKVGVGYKSAGASRRKGVKDVGRVWVLYRRRGRVLRLHDVQLREEGRVREEREGGLQCAVHAGDDRGLGAQELCQGPR